MLYILHYIIKINLSNSNKKVHNRKIINKILNSMYNSYMELLYRNVTKSIILKYIYVEK